MVGVRDTAPKKTGVWSGARAAEAERFLLTWGLIALSFFIARQHTDADARY